MVTRVPAMTIERQATARRLWASGAAMADAARELGVSYSVLHSWSRGRGLSFRLKREPKRGPAAAFVLPADPHERRVALAACEPEAADLIGRALADYATLRAHFVPPAEALAAVTADAEARAA